MLTKGIKIVFKGLLAFGFIISQAACSGTDSNNEPQNLLDNELSQFNNIYDYGTAKMDGDELVLTSTKNWFLTTKKEYSNFILTADIKLPDVQEYSNSGIIFRGSTKIKGTGVEAMGYQADVDPSPRKWTGGLFDQARRKWLNPLHSDPTRSMPDADFSKNFLPEWTDEMSNAYKHLAWNTIRIECRDNEIKIFVNNTLTTHVIDNKDKQGFIGLQHHGSKVLKNTGETTNYVRFKNIFITELQ